MLGARGVGDLYPTAPDSSLANSTPTKSKGKGSLLSYGKSRETSGYCHRLAHVLVPLLVCESFLHPSCHHPGRFLQRSTPTSGDNDAVSTTVASEMSACIHADHYQNVD